MPGEFNLKENVMGLGNRTSGEELQAVGRFGSLRNLLLSQAYAEHLDKPLAYWALPSDRRLPLALLSRTLRELLGRPFAELSATQGIGRKKIASFVMLLARAANTDPSELPQETLDPQLHLTPDPADHSADGDGFDPMNISEVTWAQWRANVNRHGFARLPLGRFSPSLRNVTRVIWNTPWAPTRVPAWPISAP